MKKRNQSLGALVFAGLAALAVYAQQNYGTCGANTRSDARPETNAPDFSITRHAKCRMSCRQIRESEVREVIAAGHINARKSDPNGKPCPAIAYEGRTSDGQLARIVVADCPERMKIITVIDLENDYPCNCD